MKKLFISLVAIVAMFATSLTANADTIALETLKQVVEEMQKMCPTDMGDGMMLETISLDDQNLTYAVSTNESPQVVEMINQMQDIMAPNLIKQLSEDEDSKYILALCKEHHINFLMKFICKADPKITATIKLRWEDM